MDIQRIIDVLERAKHDHYSEPEGLTSCLGNKHEEVDGKWQYVEYPELCDCGAVKINADIDALISELKAKQGRRITAETHAPCRIIDANGLEWKHLRWVDLDTGEAEQLVQASDGMWSITADGKHVETFLQHLKTPITVVPLER